MSIGASIFLIALGAILRYALTFEVEGVDREVIGLILMIAGFAGLGISLLYELMRDDRGGGGGGRPPGPNDPTRRY